MAKEALIEIKKGQVGRGLLIENDGFISLDHPNNKKLRENIEEFKQDLIDITPREGMEITFREAAGHYEELLAWEAN